MSRVAAKNLVYLLISFLTVESTFAGDEDLLNPYSQFDPETGYYIPIDAQPGASVPQDSETTLVPAESMSVSTGDADPTQESSPAYTQYYIVVTVLLILGGIVFRYRRYREK